MKTTNETSNDEQTGDDINDFLDRIESGLSLTDEQADKRLGEEAGKATSDIWEIESRLDADAKREANLLKTAIDELRVQMALGRMESADEIEQLEEKIEQGFNALIAATARLRHQTEEEIAEIRGKLRRAWLNLRAESVLASLRINLAQEKGVEKLAEAKEEIYEDFETIRKLAKKNVKGAQKRSAEWVEKTANSVGKRAHRVLESIEELSL